jgi:hypothetical protein
MKIKLFLCLILLMPIQTRTIGLELAAGAVVVGAILRTKVVRTMGAVSLGYFLNTTAGRQATAKFKDFVVKRMLANYEANNFALGSSSSSMVSRFYKSSDVSIFSKTSSSVASIKEKMKAMNSFVWTNSKLNFFHNSQDHIGSDHSSNSKIGRTFNRLRNSYYKTTESESTSFVHEASDPKVTNIMAQKVSGFCPKIENNYYSGNYYKGALHGSFAAWLSAWYLAKDDEDKEDKEESLKSQLQTTTHQELASLTESDSKIF